MANRVYRSLFGASLMALSLLVSCLDPDQGGGAGTSGTSLITYDEAARKILMWDDLDTVFAASGSPGPSRTLTNSQLNNLELGWGGLCVDAPSKRLYLVGKDGTVVRITNIHKQNGTVTNAQDVFTFKISTTLASPEFRQAAYDSSSNTLYVLATTTNSGSESRICAIPSPGSISSTPVTAQEIKVVKGTDTEGHGLAARSGSLYATFQGGDSIKQDSVADPWTGPRMRMTTNGGAFPETQSVLIGPATKLGKYGALAVDNSGNLYLVRHLADSADSVSPIQVYRRALFDDSFNQRPYAEFGSTADDTLRRLRLVTHAGTKDWLAAADMVGVEASDALHLWKNVSQRGTPKTMSAGSSAKIKGLALLDGSN